MRRDFFKKRRGEKGGESGAVCRAVKGELKNPAWELNRMDELQLASKRKKNKEGGAQKRTRSLREFGCRGKKEETRTPLTDRDYIRNTY